MLRISSIKSFIVKHQVQRLRIERFQVMENHIQTQKKDYVHYNHTDSCRFSRWSARESFQFMYARPWGEVSDFYSDMVNGRCSLLDLFDTQTHFIHKDDDFLEIDEAKVEGASKNDRSGRWARVTFKIVLSYHGGSFDGWQKQPGLNTVQGLVEKSVGGFVDEKKAQLLKDKGKPLEGCVVVAGRTDKGVSALRQVCSFYTWRTDIKSQEIEDAVNNSVLGKLKVQSVSKVSREFHPNFSAKWRRYVYIFPLDYDENVQQTFDSAENVYNCVEQINGAGELSSEENDDGSVNSNISNDEVAEKPRTFSVCRVNQLLQQLVGKLLSYKIFARDTKPSRNIGPPTECFLYHARAREARLPSSDHGPGRKVMCVELVANRFLRKMVRVLVATSIREAAAGAEENALLKLMDATDRRASAPPAPPDGLCLVDVGYTEFDPQNCIIT